MDRGPLDSIKISGTVIHLLSGLAFEQALSDVSLSDIAISRATLNKLYNDNTTAQQMRNAFWNLVPGSILEGNKVNLAQIAAHASVPYSCAYSLLAKTSHFLLWLVHETEETEALLKSAQHQVFDKINSVLELPHKDHRGRAKIQNLRLQIKVMEFLLRNSP